MDSRSPRHSHSQPHSRYSHPSKGRGRNSKAAGPSSPPPRSSTPRYDYSDDADESDDGREHDMDVDDEIDELLSDDEGGRRGGDEDRDEDEDEDDGGGDASKQDGQRECLWEDCNEMLEDQADLVKHVQEGVWMSRNALTPVHIGTGRQPYACLWTTCSRNGQKQASRHALLTHMRSHTGEKPYACPEPGVSSFAVCILQLTAGCGRQFTRSDAMNKHVRSIHGPGAKPRRRGEDVAALDGEEPSNADRDLAKDDDLAEVVVRLRSRDRILYRAENAEEEAAVRFMRESRPGGAPAKSRRGRRNAGSDSDEFDEGAGKRYPLERKVEGYMLDAADNEVPLMSRSRWQAKYVMAKAKLMLVDEENKMRRDELVFWEREEARSLGLPIPEPRQQPASPEPEAPRERGDRRSRQSEAGREAANHRSERVERRGTREGGRRPPDSRRVTREFTPEPAPAPRRSGGRRSGVKQDRELEPATLDDELYEAAMG